MDEKENLENKLSENTNYRSIIFAIEDMRLISINEKGIRFHVENWPDYTQDDFAKEFIYILENSLEVSFEKKDNK